MTEYLNKSFQRITINLRDLNVVHYLIGIISGTGICFVSYKTWRWLVGSRNRTNDGGQSQRILRDRGTTPQYQLLLSPNPAMLETNTTTSTRLRNVTVRRPRAREEAMHMAHANGDIQGAAMIQEMLLNVNQNVENQKQVKDEKDRHSENLLTLLYNIGEDQAKKDSIVHRGISCNICHSNPLTGIRYKCVNCVDYDVCSSCQPVCGHDTTHMFLKVIIPIPPLANPRSAIMATFYPGKNVLPSSIPWKDVLELRSHSHFDPSDIQFLYEQFKSLCTDKAGITREVFNQCIGPIGLQKNLVVDQLFKFYDRNGNGFISFSEFIYGLSIMTKGSKMEKMKYIFRGYDIDGDNYISRDDLHKMLRAYHQISVELVRDVVKSCEEEMMASYDDNGSRPISAVFNAPIPDSGLRETLTSAKSIKESKLLLNGIKDNQVSVKGNQGEADNVTWPAVEAMAQDAVSEMVDNVMKSADVNKDGKLSFEEFRNYVLMDPSLIGWFEALGTVF